MLVPWQVVSTWISFRITPGISAHRTKNSIDWLFHSVNFIHTHTHTRARARARARTHTLFLLSLIFLSLALFWQISGKSARRRSKFWWIYGISNSYWHKRISLLSGQTNKGRPCRGRVVSFCGVKRGR